MIRYYSLLPSPPVTGAFGCEQHARRKVKQCMGVTVVPQLFFFMDEGVQYGYPLQNEWIH